MAASVNVASVSPVDGWTLLFTGLVGLLALAYFVHSSTRGHEGVSTFRELRQVLFRGARRNQNLENVAGGDLDGIEDGDDILEEDHEVHDDRDNFVDELDSTDDDEAEDANDGQEQHENRNAIAFENMTERQIERAERKRRKREQREARAEWLRERERRRNAEREAYLDRQRERNQEREFEEAAERQAQQEQLREDEAVYKRWRGKISVEAGGEDTDDNQERVLEEMIEYVKENKVVRLEDVAAQFSLRTQEAKQRLENLEVQGRLSGVFDDRGKFIHVSQNELQALAKYIKRRGRVSIRELAEAQLVAVLPN
mmetsp:Transcript_7002/g.14024  ORF Transcript_7002/g.14024 Transcript_7002/m.14024 type:complete len:313 (-) Transcript_7002:1408-2346(-)